MIVIYNLFIFFFCVKIESFTPTGEVPIKTIIRIKFSEKISILKEDIEPLLNNTKNQKNISDNSNLVLIKPDVQYLKITPSINGRYRFENQNTIIFIPDKNLKPSTEYKVKLLTDKIKTKNKFILGKNFKFHTPQFAVTGINIFYNMDLIKNIEKEVVAELNFNCPVYLNKLKKVVTLSLDNVPLEIKFEPSNLPTRFYLKSRQIKRKKETAVIRLGIEKGLPCINGSIPLKKKYNETVILPETTKLEIIKTETFPIVGNTYISILFNRPVSSAMVKRYVKILSENDYKVPYKVATEYCYAVLKANFKPNLQYKVMIYHGMRSKTGEEMVKDYNYKIYFEDFTPDVQFTSRGKTLPSGKNMDLSIYTLNLYLFDVTIKKIFKNNLVYFLKNLGNSQTLLNKTIDTEDSKVNQIVPQFINLKKFHNMKYKGLFKIKVSDTKSCWNFNQKYVLCTDLEIIAKYSGEDLIVRVCSVKNLIPQSGVKIKLVNKKNQVIKQGITDESGSLVIKDWEIFYYNYSPYFLLAEIGNDFSFLKFRDPKKDHTPVNTERKVISEKGMKALLTPEKGIYKPGEKAYITVILRKNNLTPLPPVNVQLYITDPLGEKFKILKKKIPPKGIMSFEVFFPSYVKTGEYTLTLKLNENIKLGRTYIKIENLSLRR